MENKLTKKECVDIVSSMVVLHDTREKKNLHILEYFEAHDIKNVRATMDVGDYTYILPNHESLGLCRTTLIERKASLDELAGNFTTGRDRFAREFERMGPTQNIHLVLEGFTWTKVLSGSYRSKFHPNSYKASLISWSIRYGFPVWGVTKENAGEIIYEILKKDLQHKLEKYSK